MCTIVGKKIVPTIDKETKIPSFAILFCSLDILIWIKAEVEKKDFAS
jgi:hypothetical protein